VLPEVMGNHRNPPGQCRRADNAAGVPFPWIREPVLSGGRGRQKQTFRMIGRDVESYRAGIASDTTGKLATFLQLRGRAHCEADEGRS